MVVVLILVSAALVVTLAMLTFGSNRGGVPSGELQAKVDESNKAREKAEADLDKKRKELEEQRLAHADVRDQLKQAKRKLHDQKESGKEDRDLQHAREEVERTASTQLEVVRTELHDAQHEIDRLKAELEMTRGRKSHSAPAPAPAPVAVAVAAPQSAPEPQRVVRELSPQDKEKMDRLEHQSSKDRAKAADLERELKRVKSKAETQQRVYVVTKGEAELVKDKFKALEKRLNRTLLERDLLRRAIADLAAKSGVAVDRTELTADEIALSDRTVDERIAAEAAEAAKAQQKLAAEPAKEMEAVPLATAAVAQTPPN